MAEIVYSGESYETVYEARNRPSWVEIPVAALRRLSARVPSA